MGRKEEGFELKLVGRSCARLRGMTTTFHVTYDVVTPESAEHADVAEAGFLTPHGGQTTEAIEWTLHQVIQYFGCRGFDDGGSSFYSCDSTQDYRTGAETSYAVHPYESITGSSYRRVKRFLVGR